MEDHREGGLHGPTLIVSFLVGEERTSNSAELRSERHGQACKTAPAGCVHTRAVHAVIAVEDIDHGERGMQMSREIESRSQIDENEPRRFRVERHARGVVDDRDAVDGGADGEHAIANLRQRFSGGCKQIVGCTQETIGSGMDEGADSPSAEEVGDITSPPYAAPMRSSVTSPPLHWSCGPLKSALASTHESTPSC